MEQVLDRRSPESGRPPERRIPELHENMKWGDGRARFDIPAQRERATGHELATANVNELFGNTAQIHRPENNGIGMLVERVGEGGDRQELSVRDLDQYDPDLLYEGVKHQLPPGTTPEDMRQAKLLVCERGPVVKRSDGTLDFSANKYYLVAEGSSFSSYGSHNEHHATFRLENNQLTVVAIEQEQPSTATITTGYEGSRLNYSSPQGIPGPMARSEPRPQPEPGSAPERRQADQAPAEAGFDRSSTSQGEGQKKGRIGRLAARLSRSKNNEPNDKPAENAEHKPPEKKEGWVRPDDYHEVISREVQKVEPHRESVEGLDIEEAMREIAASVEEVKYHGKLIPGTKIELDRGDDKEPLKIIVPLPTPYRGYGQESSIGYATYSSGEDYWDPELTTIISMFNRDNKAAFPTVFPAQGLVFKPGRDGVEVIYAFKDVSSSDEKGRSLGTSAMAFKMPAEAARRMKEIIQADPDAIEEFIHGSLSGLEKRQDESLYRTHGVARGMSSSLLLIDIPEGTTEFDEFFALHRGDATTANANSLYYLVKYGKELSYLSPHGTERMDVLEKYQRYFEKRLARLDRLRQDMRIDPSWLSAQLGYMIDHNGEPSDAVNNERRRRFLRYYWRSEEELRAAKRAIDNFSSSSL